MFTNFQRLFIPWFWSLVQWAVWVARPMVPRESRTFWQFWFYIPRSSKVQSFVLEFMLGMWLQKPFVLETGVGVLGAYIQSWSVLGQPFQLAQGSIRESFLEFLADSSPNWSHNIDEAWTYMNIIYHSCLCILSYPISICPRPHGAGPSLVLARPTRPSGPLTRTPAPTMRPVRPLSAVRGSVGSMAHLAPRAPIAPKARPVARPTGPNVARLQGWGMGVANWALVTNWVAKQILYQGRRAL